MSNVDPTLRFPSGLTVAQIKQAAKRLAREEGITHTEALDTLARANGIDLHWAAAVAVLAKAHLDAPRHEQPRRKPAGPYGAYADGRMLARADSETRRLEGVVRRRIDSALERRLTHAVQEYFDSGDNASTLAAIHNVPLRLLRNRISRYRSECRQRPMTSWLKRADSRYRASGPRPGRDERR